MASYQTGICSICYGEYPLLTGSGCIKEHYIASRRKYAGSGMYVDDQLCYGSGRKPLWSKCLRCGNNSIAPDKAHFNPDTGLLCRPVEAGDVTGELVKSVQKLQKTWDSALKKTLSTPPPHLLEPGPGAYRPKGQARSPADRVISTELGPVVIPEDELCQGGRKPKTGCKDCGDQLYMTVTGRDGQKPPVLYEGWRNDHDRTGLPWARERMLDHMRPEHNGVLDEGWKPLPVRSDDPPVTAARNQPVYADAVCTLFAIGAVAWLVAGMVTAERGYFFAAGLWAILSFWRFMIGRR